MVGIDVRGHMRDQRGENKRQGAGETIIAADRVAHMLPRVGLERLGAVLAGSTKREASERPAIRAEAAGAHVRSACWAWRLGGYERRAESGGESTWVSGAWRCGGGRERWPVASGGPAAQQRQAASRAALGARSLSARREIAWHWAARALRRSEGGRYCAPLRQPYGAQCLRRRINEMFLEDGFNSTDQ
ncbi:hypothetical protein FGB62_180g06 [Gracilaria domingensis]|nr:hypothetical protein FGB62_180g06 [Gracilaria domingensis]